ncbi:hypothetical protein ILYODFUR_020250 [Ilyodon furcidens]|uniref:Uncharacterized protein n=1 Tax=Ilyodon furcidens TaxID=33524 RepID=A0ABV0SNP7_9TELE
MSLSVHIPGPLLSINQSSLSRELLKHITHAGGEKKRALSSLCGRRQMEGLDGRIRKEHRSPLYHDSTLMDVRVVEGQGRWRLESCG